MQSSERNVWRQRVARARASGQTTLPIPPEYLADLLNAADRVGRPRTLAVKRHARADRTGSQYR